jgi:histidinol-phosphate aminotransferase
VSINVRIPEKTRTASPYQAGRPIDEVARELGLDPTTIVKLASNENPLGMSPHAAAALAGVDSARYPDANAHALKVAIAAHHDIDPSWLTLGNGSENVLELITKVFLEPGTSAVSSQYAFIVWDQSVRAVGAESIVVAARAYGNDLEAMRAAIRDDTVAVYIANPNNPTGTYIESAELVAFIESVPSSVLVVLDEAYNEYLPPEHRVDTISYVRRFSNVIITRTFSKVYGLAGLRIGYAVSHPEVAELLNRLRLVFNVSAPGQAAAAAALGDTDFLQRSYELNLAGMHRLSAVLDELGLEYVESMANFIMMRVGDGAKVNASLLRQGVIVRPMAMYGLPEWLRVSIGLPEENERFISALKVALAE